MIGILDDLAKDLFSNPAIYNINSVRMSLDEHLFVLGVADVAGKGLNSRKCSGRRMPLVVNVAKGDSGVLVFGTFCFCTLSALLYGQRCMSIPS
jgi:hypothetical protein